MTDLVHNERTKLSSRFLCNIGICMLVIAIVAPVVGRHDPFGLVYAGGLALVGILCIAVGVWLPGRMR